MMNQFNIALLPQSKSEDYINVAKKLYNIAGNYRIGHESLPHVTLCQFIADESDIESIWNKVCESEINPVIELTLETFSCISIDRSNWVSLVPNNLNELMRLHCSVANLIERRMGRCFEKYDAHMTLINTNHKHLEEVVQSLNYDPIKDLFKLSLGISDNLGQFKRVIYSCDVEKITSLKVKL